MKKIIFYLISLISLAGYSQNQQTTDLDKLFKSHLNFKSNSPYRDYYVTDSDTVFCTDLSYKITIQSYLSKVSYVNSDDKNITLKGKKNLRNISTFYINGETIDRIPQKTNKPKKYIKWASRVVDGKLIVNYYDSSISTISSTDGYVTTNITKF